MNWQTSSGVKLSTLDFVFSVMDSSQSPLDFTVLLHLAAAPRLEALQTGAISARNRFPTTGSYLRKKEWIRFHESGDGVKAVSISTEMGVTRAIEEFLDAPFDLHRQMPVQQLLVKDVRGPHAKLVTRFHHAAADGLSAAMWLGHQLRVAYEEENPVTRALPFQDLRLRRPASSVNRSRFAPGGPSDRLWTSGVQRSGVRRWLTISVSAADLRTRCRRHGGFTSNDLLVTCALEVFTLWNQMHGAGCGQKVGLWLPINIRQRSFVGFGNGTSRIRLYATYPKTASFAEKCREIRSQVKWSTRHGEWVVPDGNPITSLPQWAVTSLLRRYLNRPSADVATGVFSNVESSAELNGGIFDRVEKIECIGLLHPRQCVAINGTTRRGQTWLTFTYDPNLLFADDILRLAEMYQQQIALAQRELT